ncbi:PrsW family intramembrane metalloprotease [Candidatus Peregrinibacteria bacterium]|jgi:RsiW-degrading membrane proteinase PrsW (M82 family)|nr:PrsW family intramembrane metalloprotease [Candidatus Peregrinibacteria bacterium]MBT4148302.1 PrsW family intramembrane metalloprotease [Candidatus Peregrinibacteria bacterium]MBT4366439.1 PrsW family intramembrane metalloprotease [Candidatus Peregrinibacteria bacterium]MBT4455945.1 PrsW family intramembrane metalloprotease [Candidatus Peregrinibacteria bacterium]
MLNSPALVIALATTVAAIPAAIWGYLFFKETDIRKLHLIILFLLGMLTAPTLLGVQYLWNINPTFNLSLLIETRIAQVSLMYAALFTLFGAMEEIIKHFAVRIIDKKTVAIKTLNNALRLSILSGLGFAFAENIYYLYSLWGALAVGELVGVFIFRSVFTMCAHMIFSGIFGFYFGVSKFAVDITKQQRLVGKADLSTRMVAKLVNIPVPKAHREKTILKGLLISVGMHAAFNYLLQYNMMIPVIISVVLGYLFLRYLLKRKAGHLVLLTDVSEKEKSMLPKKDEDVVLELLGLWFKDRRYVDVIHICERLLERDPDNNVVKLFKAKAMDHVDDKNAYKKILKSVLRSKDDLSVDDRNIISKYLEQKGNS